LLVRGRIAAAEAAVELPGGRTAPEVRYPLPAHDVAQIDRDNDVILVRWQGAVYAFARSCPHQNTALLWLEQDARFQCPKHKSRYQPDGTFISGRATRSMDRFALKLEGNEVVVDLAVLHRQDKDPEGWAGAVVRPA
jgi:Rieske Fe-S protein